ncbi:MAG: nitrilase-related carbon-nitrogen hydrolase [Fidelibacterota bacterium]
MLGITRKVYLTETEKDLDVSPGRLEDVEVYNTPFGKVGVAISLDAFTDKYVRWLDDHGCQIIVQPDANNHRWADTHPQSGIWQPKEWMWSTFGSIQQEYKNIQVNICPMIVGNLFDLVFDGQSSITAKSADFPRKAYVGVDRMEPDPYYFGRYRGRFLAMSQWVTEGGPDDIDRLREMAKSLEPGGSRDNQYHEDIIWADLEVNP